MQLAGAGLTVELPPGWEGTIDRRLPLQGDGPSSTVTHLANFPLAASRADFGGDVVESMRPGDVFVVVFEYGEGSADKALFAAQGAPSVRAADFDRDALQHGVPGQSGLQRFFRIGARAFCVYVVVGSHIDRADAVGPVNSILASLVVG